MSAAVAKRTAVSGNRRRSIRERVVQDGEAGHHAAAAFEMFINNSLTRPCRGFRPQLTVPPIL